MSIVELKNVNKNYGAVKALKNLDLEVKKGEVMGFIGPNGAGKTTAVRIILGLLKKDSGEAKVFGLDAFSNTSEIHKKVAYVPGDVTLWPNLTGGEFIDLIGSLRGGLNKEKKEYLIKLFDFDPTKKCRTYSKGNRQKVALIAAFASDAELYILDEPTSGLDPLMELNFQKCVNEAKSEGKTVLLSSHILAEVEKLCDRVSIIRQGEIVEVGTIDELRHLTRLSVDVQLEKPLKSFEHPNIHDVKIENDKIHFQVDTNKIGEVLEKLSSNKIVNIISSPPSLEELFMHHYGDDINEE